MQIRRGLLNIAHLEKAAADLPPPAAFSVLARADDRQ
jgi:hypothetical protein